jgi:hypothetical protein
MSFGVTATIAGLTAAGITIWSQLEQANQARSAAEDQRTANATAQQKMDQAIAESKIAQQAGLTQATNAMQPYTDAGAAAIKSQQDLSGANGPEAQKAAIAGIQGSEQFNALAQQGEQGILANASATGGLRGGNTQGALAQFRPQLLGSLIDQQYQRLGGLSSLGFGGAGQIAQANLATGQGLGNTMLAGGQFGAQNALDLGAINAGAQMIPGPGQIVSSAINTGIGTFGSMYRPSAPSGGGWGSPVTPGIASAPAAKER